MPSWYGIKDFSRSREEGIRENAAMEIEPMRQYIGDGEQECTDTDMASSNVFIGGFSQGGAMAVYYGYHFADRAPR